MKIILDVGALGGVVEVSIEPDIVYENPCSKDL